MLYFVIHFLLLWVGGVVSFFSSYCGLMRSRGCCILEGVGFCSILEFLVHVLTGFTVPVCYAFATGGGGCVLASRGRQSGHIVVSLASFPTHVRQV